MTLRRAVLPLLLLLLGLSTAARADAYLGASFVRTESELGPVDSESDGWKAYFGSTILKFLALEASYRDLGNQSENTILEDVDIDVTGYDIGARGILPIAPFFAIFARVGYGMISIDGTTREGVLTFDVDEDDWELMYGAGLEFKFGKLFGLRAEWEEYDVDTSLTSYSAGAFLRF